MATFSHRINSSSDDGYEQSGTMYIGATHINVNNASQIAGLRFPGVTIPAGSTIDVCYITLDFVSTGFDDPDVTIYGELAANPSQFTTTANDISNRSVTTAGVDWDIDTAGLGAENTPSLVTVMQEIIDQGGWASGNAVVFLFYPNNSGTLLRAYSYDTDSAKAPLLYVEYTAPSGGSSRQRKRHLSLGMEMGSKLGF